MTLPRRLVDQKPTRERVQDRKYLDWLRTQRCVVSGAYGNDFAAVDPAHIGTYGRGLKTDDEALPISHLIHVQMHQRGEMSVLREIMPDWLLRECLRAYARQLYAEYKNVHR